MTSYDIFANYYDATIGNRPDAVAIVQRAISTHHPKAQSILELGCGTGSVIKQLEANFEVWGLDQSQNMLLKAQQKLPKNHLYQADMTAFELDQTFDVIICIFDSINHLASLKDWAATFDQAARHLNPGGLLVFDMNTTGRLDSLATLGTYTQTLPGDITVDMDVTPAGPASVDWHITIQAPGSDGVIEVHEDHARERSYPLIDVKKTLSQHFEVLECFNDNSQPPTDNDARVYFVARLKNS